MARRYRTMASRYKKVQPWLRAHAAYYLTCAGDHRRAALASSNIGFARRHHLRTARMLMEWARRYRRYAFLYPTLPAFNERPGPWSLWVG